MIPQWENEFISMSVLSVIRVHFPTVAFSRADHTLLTRPEPVWQKMGWYFLNATTQPGGIDGKAGVQPRTDNGWKNGVPVAYILSITQSICCSFACILSTTQGIYFILLLICTYTFHNPEYLSLIRMYTIHNPDYLSFIRMYTIHNPEYLLLYCMYTIHNPEYLLLICRYTIPNPECFEQTGSRVFNNKAIRVESRDKTDLLVYGVNRDTWSADG